MRRAGVDVVVPSHRRPVALEQCLAGLAAQEHRPDRVVVVARADDTQTWDVATGAAQDLPVVVATVEEPGVVAALAAGVAATVHPRVAFTDDDAVPLPRWLAGLVALLDEPGVGVAGGRDLVPGELEPCRRNVGTLASWGRFTGDHHLGDGPARDVHVVKGVNMAFREDALAVPRAGVLVGAGAQPHYEKLMCAWARSRGWRVRYDPAVVVDHRVVRDESLDRGPDPRTGHFGRVANAHNAMLGALATDPDHGAMHVAYGFLAGSRETPGVARSVWALANGQIDVARRLGATFIGLCRALGAVRPLDEVMIACVSELRGGNVHVS
jgi:hypothetical protein